LRSPDLDWVIVQRECRSGSQSYSEGLSAIIL